MLERVDARHDTAGAVTEQEHGQARFTRLRRVIRVETSLT
jgi:hypothetical protein